MAGKTRSRLILEIASLVIGKYPVTWNAKELALATDMPVRTVERALKEMADAGLLEKKYHSYTLSIDLVNQIYGAQWYVRQEIDKTMIIKRKGDAHETNRAQL